MNASLTPDLSATSLFLSSQKMYDPKKVNIGSATTSNFKDIDEYYKHINKESDISLKARHEVDQIMRDKYLIIARALHQVKLHLPTTAHEVEDSMVVMDNEYEHIKALEQQIIKKDLVDYERMRRTLAGQLVDLQREIQELKPDQVQERIRIEGVHKEVSTRLLYIEERTSTLRRTLKLDLQKPGFSTNANLHTSALELSIISMQRDVVQQWEMDPEREKTRKVFVDRLMKEWHNLQSKRETKIRETEQAIASEESKLKALEEEQKKEMNDKKKADCLQRLQVAQQRQEERVKDLAQQNQRLLVIQNEQTLAKRYAILDTALETDELQKRKQKLAEIKNTYKPINLDEINEHDHKFLNTQLEKAQVRESKKDQRASEWNQYRAQYFSENYRKVQEDTKLAKNPMEDGLRQAQEKVQKQKFVEKNIKENFLPKIDEKKSKEMEELRSQIHHTKDFKQYSELSTKIRAKRRFDGVKKVQEKTSKLTLTENMTDGLSPRTIGMMYLKGTRQPHPVTSISPAEEVKLPNIQSESKFKPRDYLKEIRDKKIIKNRDILNDWKTYASKNSKGDEGNEELMKEIGRLEKAAKRQEQLLRARNVSDNKLIQHEEVVDALLVNSIKAKLLVLDRDVVINQTEYVQKSKTSLQPKIKAKPRTATPVQQEDSYEQDEYYDDDD